MKIKKARRASTLFLVMTLSHCGNDDNSPATANALDAATLPHDASTSLEGSNVNPSDAGSHPLPDGGRATSLGAIFSGVPLLDTDGNVINAHGVGFLKVGNTYYMVGEQRSGKNDSYSGHPENAEDMFTGVNMYSTTDLVNWTFVGTVVKPVPNTVVAPPYYGERPKILYNASTKKYVIYIKMLDFTKTYASAFAVLSSSTIAGPYAYQGTLSITKAEDFNVFQDTDGSQYFAHTGGGLYKFAADGLSIDPTPVKTSIEDGEGPSLYKAGGTYFWQGNSGGYWHAIDSDAYATATSLTGNWTNHGKYCPTGTMGWNAQDTAVLPIDGTAGSTYVYFADRWVNGDLPASTLVIQPLAVSGSTESIPTYNPIWSLDVNKGTWAPLTPVGTSINDTVMGTGVNQFNYDSHWKAGSCTDCSGNDSHTATEKDAVATLAFTGTQVLLYSAYDDASGIMGITLGDASGTPITPEVHVSLRYDAPPAGNYMVYASPKVPSGSYTLKVRATGTMDLYSTGDTCTIDRALVIP